METPFNGDLHPCQIIHLSVSVWFTLFHSIIGHSNVILGFLFNSKELTTTTTFSTTVQLDTSTIDNSSTLPSTLETSSQTGMLTHTPTESISTQPDANSTTQPMGMMNTTSKTMVVNTTDTLVTTEAVIDDNTTTQLPTDGVVPSNHPTTADELSTKQSSSSVTSPPTGKPANTSW